MTTATSDDPRTISAVFDRDGTYRKVFWHIIPFLLLCYLICRIDTAIVGYAKLQFNQQLHLTEAVYGLGAGIFYLGYAICELPSNLYMAKYGIRRTLLRIMVLWGGVTVATLFITSGTQFVVARFLLGLAEGGFFPGVLLYLTYWLPPDRRAKGFSYFIMANPIAGALGGVLSGWIMQSGGGFLGLTGWQALFLWMGLPAIVLGVVGFFVLSDRPEASDWLTSPEKNLLAREAAGGGAVPKSKFSGLADVLRNSRVYVAALIYFTVVSTLTMFTVWSPTIVQALGSKTMLVTGLFAAVPYIFGLLGLFLIGRNSDRTLERHWHFILCTLASTAGIGALYFMHTTPMLGIACLSIAAFGLFGAFGVFFSIPAAFLGSNERAAGLAVITTIGNLAGFVMPWLSGIIQSVTGNLYLGIMIFSVMSFLGAVLMIFFPKPNERSIGA